jgi:hypothetical protein
MIFLYQYVYLNGLIYYFLIRYGTESISPTATFLSQAPPFLSFDMIGESYQTDP